MSYIEYNPNPSGLSVGDCTIRAISKALNLTWKETYLYLLIQGYSMYDMPSSNRVWGQFLREKGFIRHQIPNNCPDCYTINDFCKDHPKGTFVVGTGTHVVCIIDGSYFDTWDSGMEVPIYYFERR